jgi:hypothetical protein
MPNMNIVLRKLATTSQFLAWEELRTEFDGLPP